MAEGEDRSLERRVERLEEKLYALTHKIDELRCLNKARTDTPTSAQAASTPAPPKPTPATPPPPQQAYTKPAEPAFKLPEHMRRWEYWLNKLGIALLLFGVAFLFKYSIDQGWLTPWIRVAFGIALGVVLIVLGLRIYEKKRHFSLVLLGGGIATFYITGFSAFQLLKLVSHPVAFGFMIAVTILAFAMSLKQNEATLSLLGVIGGLGTPFLLYTGVGNVPGLVTYTCLILAGTVGIYFYRGWRSVLWASVIGGWIVMLVTRAACEGYHDRVAAQWGLGNAWLLFWFLPVLREVVSVGNPERWPKSFMGFGDTGIARPTKAWMDRHVHALSVSSPLIALAISMSVWPHWDTHSWAAVALGGAVVYGLASWWLSRFEPLHNLAYTQGAVGAVLGTLALCLYFDGNTLLFALAAEAAALHLIAIRRNDKLMTVGAHLLFWAVAIWLLYRLLSYDRPDTSAFHVQLLTDIWVVAVAVALSQLLRHIVERQLYLYFAAAALALLLMRELDGNVLLLALLVEVVVIHLVAKWKDDQTVTIAGHLGFGLMALWLLRRLFSDQVGDLAVFNATAIVDLTLIAAGAALCRIFDTSRQKAAYLLAAHVGLLLWFLRELHGLPDGQGYVTIAWGVYAVLLLLLGLRLNYNQLRVAALSTLLLVVGKLFLVDLAKLETIWRVLLFICFGGVFLALSYWFQSLWKQKAKD
jgi:uncharacterized membrane protein